MASITSFYKIFENNRSFFQFFENNFSESSFFPHFTLGKFFFIELVTMMRKENLPKNFSFSFSLEKSPGKFFSSCNAKYCLKKIYFLRFFFKNCPLKDVCSIFTQKNFFCISLEKLLMNFHSFSSKQFFLHGVESMMRKYWWREKEEEGRGSQ